MTTAMVLKNIRRELCHVLRNADIFTVAVRGVTTTSQTFTATASQTAFTLTNTTVKNVRSLTVQGSAKKYLFDYTINFGTGVVTLNTGATLNDTVVIQYDYGTGDKIWTDLPRADLSLTSFPRVGIALTNINTKPLGLGGHSFISDILVSIFAYMPVNKDSSIAGGLGGTDDLSDLMEDIRQAIITNAQAFYNFKWIEPMSIGPIIPSTNGKLMQQNHDFNAKFIVES